MTSREHCGSTFTFVLPYKVSNTSDSSDDPDELTGMANHDGAPDDTTENSFQFDPRTLGSLFNSKGSARTQKLLPHNIVYTSSRIPNNFYSFPTSIQNETADVAGSLSSEPESPVNHTANPDRENGACRSEQGQDDKNDQFPNPCKNSGWNREGSREIDAIANINKDEGERQRQ